MVARLYAGAVTNTGRWWRWAPAVAVLALVLLAGCGGPPAFHGGPGELRAAPLDFGQGQGDHRANITVGGTGLFVFTQGYRRLDGVDEISLSAVPESGEAVQRWLAKGGSMDVAGLTVTVLAIYPGDGESGWADVRVTVIS